MKKIIDKRIKKAESILLKINKLKKDWVTYQYGCGMIEDYGIQNPLEDLNKWEDFVKSNLDLDKKVRSNGYKME